MVVLDVPVLTGPTPYVPGIDAAGKLTGLVDTPQVTNTIASEAALTTYTGPVTSLMLPDGRTYKRVTTSVAVDGLTTLASATSGTKWVLSNKSFPLTLSQLRAISTPASMTNLEQVFLLDGVRQGTFFLDRLDVGSSDDGGCCLVTASGLRYKRQTQGQLTPQNFGAKGDGVTDDTAAFAALFKSNRSVVIPPVATFYKVTGTQLFTNVRNLDIQATGAVLLNSDLTRQSWLFQTCQNIKIVGGDWGFQVTPIANGNASQHTMQFDQSSNVLIDGVHIRNSPEMGIALTQCYDVTIQKSWIEHTWRDGTYAHYSAKINFLDNKYNDCKDDACSFHDYGRVSERSFLEAMGIHQAQDFRMEGCQITNCYQGFGSVAGKDLVIRNNTIRNTVIAGIALMNQKLLYPDGTTRLTNAVVDNNTLENTCSTTVINGISYPNFGQASTGRAAIICVSLGDNNQLMLTEPKRQSNVQIRENKILSSGAQGIGVYNTDIIKVSGNLVMNCTVSGNSLGGAPVEFWECTQYDNESKNTVIDTRQTPQHVYGYKMDGVSGRRGSWSIVNATTAENVIVNSPGLQRQLQVDLEDIDAYRKLPTIDTALTTNWNTYIQQGTRQVTGGSIGAAPNNPFTLPGIVNAGTLETAVALDSLKQTYTDINGKVVYRHLFGLTNGTWSGWKKLLVDGDISTPVYTHTYDTSSWTPGTYTEVVPAGTLLENGVYVLRLRFDDINDEVILQTFVLPGVPTQPASIARTGNLVGNGDAYSGSVKRFLLRYAPGTALATAKLIATPSDTGLSGSLAVSVTRLA